jgi:hypothetical protein
VREQYPDKIIDTLAYTYTRKPPKYVKPAPNVAVRLCSIECCFAHPLESCPVNKTFVEDIINWSKICKRLHIWDYVINYAHCIQPFPNFRVLKPNINFFINHGVTGIYEEANYFSKGGELAELRTYVLAKCLWDPSYDDKKAVFDFTEAYYGPAGQHIRDYLELIHTVCDKPGLHLRIYTSPNNYLNDPEMLAKASVCLDKALEAVKDDETLRHRVEVATLPLIYTKIALVNNSFWRKGNMLSTSIAESDLLNVFERVAKKEGINAVAEGRSYNDWVEKQKKSKDAEGVDIVQLESSSFLLEILPKLGGRIWRAVDKKSGYELLRVVGDDKSGLAPGIGGYEEYNCDEYRGGGHMETYQLVEQSADTVILRCQFKDGAIATRRISILPDQAGFTVTTQFTGIKDMKARSCRVHPEFHIVNAEDAVLRTKTMDGSFTEAPLNKLFIGGEIWLNNDKLIPNNEWAIQFPLDGRKATLTCRFNREDVSICYINVDGSEERINLEEWTKKLPLTPTSGPRLSNTYLFTVE